MSGHGLWFIILNYDGKSYSTDCRLIGIMSEFRKAKYFYMIGEKMKILLDAMLNFKDINIKQKKTTHNFATSDNAPIVALRGS